MVFVSYSHADKIWMDRFKTMSAPLRRYAEVSIWSDRDIQAGADWKATIDREMRAAKAVVLLVSANFLDSDFIANEELPYILAATRDNKIHLFWVPLGPCNYELTGLRKLQTKFDPKFPLNSMGQFEYESALKQQIAYLDEVVRKFETPKINKALAGRSLQREEKKLQVLESPALRETEVLVFSGDGKWYTQHKVRKGEKEAHCWIGDKNSKSGDSFQIIALTRYADEKLSIGSPHPNIPIHRTKSGIVNVKRA